MPAFLIRKLEGDFENILVRDVKTKVAAHLQIPVGDNSRRVVAAMPPGKAALCFETEQPAGWSNEEAPVTFAGMDGQNGVAFTLASNRDAIAIPISSILLNHTLMARFGSDPDYRNERRLRDLIESGGVRDVASKLGMSLQDLSDRGKIVGPIVHPGQGKITFTRRSLGGRHQYRLELIPGRATEVTASGDRLRFVRSNPSTEEPLRLTIRASTSFELFTPMPFDDLLNDRGRYWAGKDKHFAQAVRNFEFLAFREKFLAGSWNFLSYFGRDTLIAIRIMWHILSRQAKQTGIESVLNETSESGIVNVTDEWTDDRTVADAIEVFFREYDKGHTAVARQLMQTVLDGRVPEHPFLDVLDQTFMFPSAAAHWFKEISDEDLLKWLKDEHQALGRTESNLATLLRNWNYVLGSASPYIEDWKGLRAKHPGLTARQIIETHEDEFKKTHRALIHSIAGAANWRDTYCLPWNFKPEDINVNLLPMAIAVIQEMIERIRATACGQDMIDLTKAHPLNAVRCYLEEPSRFDAAREAWDWDLMRDHYLVRRSANEIRQDLERYLEGLKNGEVLGQDRGIQERGAILQSRESGVMVSDFLQTSRVPTTVKDGVEFTALLLDPDGKPLPVMHSDDVFLLLFGNPAIQQVRKILHLLMLSYPFGLSFLDDDIGIAVTNAVYSPRDNRALGDNTKNVWVKFGPDEYHGRVAWPWSMLALICGIHDQVMKSVDHEGRPRNGVTRNDVELFRKLLNKLKTSIEKLGPLAMSEVYKFAPAKAKDGMIWQAEPMGISTPVQLWSAAPANMLIDEALEKTGLALGMPRGQEN